MVVAGLALMILGLAACSATPPTPFPSPLYDCRTYDSEECIPVLNEAAEIKPTATHLRLVGPAAPPQSDRTIWMVETLFEDGSRATVHCDQVEGKAVACFELELQASGQSPTSR